MSSVASCSKLFRKASNSFFTIGMLIEEWAEADSLPLYVRKYKDNRGWKIPHETGRILVPTDNSPATWAFVLAYTGNTPTLKEITALVDRDLIPVAFALNKTEKKRKDRYK